MHGPLAFYKLCNVAAVFNGPQQFSFGRKKGRSHNIAVNLIAVLAAAHSGFRSFGSAVQHSCNRAGGAFFGILRVVGTADADHFLTAESVQLQKSVIGLQDNVIGVQHAHGAARSVEYLGHLCLRAQGLPLGLASLSNVCGCNDNAKDVAVVVLERNLAGVKIPQVAAGIAVGFFTGKRLPGFQNFCISKCCGSGNFRGQVVFVLFADHVLCRTAYKSLKLAVDQYISASRVNQHDHAWLVVHNRFKLPLPLAQGA